MIAATEIQRLLRAAGYYAGDIDGDIGPQTRGAIRKVLAANAARLPADWRKAGAARQMIMAVQVILTAAGFQPGPVDGYAGTLTRQALTEWNQEQAIGRRPLPWRPDDVPEPADDSRPAPVWGRQRDMDRRFGPAGGPQCTRGRVTPPWPMLLAWNTRASVSTISCHEAVADSLDRVLRRVASAYSPEAIQRLGLHLFGGCFAMRNKRGGSTLSTHAYGVAVDWDPERNQLKWTRARARLGKPDAEEWWRCWEAEGWTSLGRARNFDWMHVQAPGL